MSETAHTYAYTFIIRSLFSKRWMGYKTFYYRRRRKKHFMADIIYIETHANSILLATIFTYKSTFIRPLTHQLTHILCTISTNSRADRYGLCEMLLKIMGTLSIDHHRASHFAFKIKKPPDRKMRL